VKEGWKVRQIEDVTFIQEGPGIRKYEYEEDGFPMINVRCVQDGYIDMSSARAANTELATGKWKHFQVDAGDILFTISGTIGRCAVVQESDLPLLMNTSVVRFRPTVPELDSRFLYLFLQSDGFQAPLRELSSGTAIRNVGPTHIKTLSIPLPPLEEQQRIVAILDEAFEGLARARAHAETNLRNARELFLSHLSQAMSSATINWVCGTLEEVSQIFAGGDVDKSRTSKSRTDQYNVPVYTNGEKEDGLYGYTDAARVTEPSITVSARGTIGFTAIRDHPFYPAIRLIVVTPNRNIIDLEFLAFYIRSQTIAQSGASIPQLTVPMIKTLKVAQPPLAEQRSIAASLKRIEAVTLILKEEYDRKLADLADLRQSLLQKAFAGELTAKEFA
tara:strand:+ start:3245 stop:4411 length:1167 start_codon:yes stop_codon:yes gene_type:complete